MNVPAAAATTTTVAAAATPKPTAAPTAPVKLVPPSAAKPAPTVVAAKETTVVRTTPTVSAPAVVAAPVVVRGAGQEALPGMAPPAVVAPKPKGFWGLPTWAWIAIGVGVLLILAAIIGEFVVRRRRQNGGGGNTAYTLVANSNPVCDIADNKCDVASGTNEASAEACKARCDKVSGCEGVLYDRSGLLGGANCWVKRFNTSPPKMDAWNGADFYYKKTATA